MARLRFSIFQLSNLGLWNTVEPSQPPNPPTEDPKLEESHLEPWVDEHVEASGL